MDGKRGIGSPRFPQHHSTMADFFDRVHISSAKHRHASASKPRGSA